MSDKQKALFILNLLAKQELRLGGASEAFKFTQSYNWLVELAKELDKPVDIKKAKGK